MELPNNFPADFHWLDGDRLAVDLREDRAMVIDASSGEVTRDVSWGEARAALTPWRVAVLADEEGAAGPVVLQELDAAGELVDERQMEFSATPFSAPVLAEDRIAIGVTTEDESVLEPGWDGVTPESVDLVLAYDGAAQSYLSVLQVGRDLDVTPLRWVDRGTLIVSVTADGLVHYLLWDTQNGGTQLLTKTGLIQLSQGPVFGDITP